MKFRKSILGAAFLADGFLLGVFFAFAEDFAAGFFVGFFVAIGHRLTVGGLREPLFEARIGGLMHI